MGEPQSPRAFRRDAAPSRGIFSTQCRLTPLLEETKGELDLCLLSLFAPLEAKQSSSTSTDSRSLFCAGAWWRTGACSRKTKKLERLKRTLET